MALYFTLLLYNTDYLVSVNFSGVVRAKEEI